ncbi:MAG: integration host factor subunit beta [Deltaproteobacteria bacterium]|nr:integration host factor subunit beta [Deltaproteobacteria bacterium]
MLKSELIERTFSNHADVLRGDLELLVNLFFETMSDALRKGDAVEIRGLGRLKVVERKPRAIRNPKTGETSYQPARRQIHFKAGKEILERINR